MKALLVRVGIDATAGKWNGPYEPRDHSFVYVPIPESKPVRPEIASTYAEVRLALSKMAGRVEEDAKPAALELPPALRNASSHLDPDFEKLTYGDTARRGRRLRELERGDLLVFYAGLKAVRSMGPSMVYAIIGHYEVDRWAHVSEVERARWGENAHTRRAQHQPDDIVVYGRRRRSGRRTRAIPIGEYRDGAYRVRSDVLKAWGGLDVKNGYIQRSAVPPWLTDAARFARWLGEQEGKLVASNNP